MRLPAMIQGWHSICFVHWAYPPQTVQALLPLELLTFEGKAWVGLTPFRLSISPPITRLVKLISSALEVNVRTYVRSRRGREGIWFFSLDLPRLDAVLGARVGYQLPYYWSRSSASIRDRSVDYISQRRSSKAHLRMSILEGAPIEDPQLSELDVFLTARWRQFSYFGPKPFETPVEHPPWPLQRATVLEMEQDLIEAAGLPTPAGNPIVHYSPGVWARIGFPRPA